MDCRYRSWMKINAVLSGVIVQVIHIILLLPGIPLPATGQNFALAIRQQTERYCNSDAECNTSRGERCRVYDGCSKGLCVCDPRAHGQRNAQSCSMSPCGQSCPDTMVCERGRCVCRHGQSTSDGLFCRHSDYKLLGERCAPNRDTCFHKTDVGYLSTAVMCSADGQCRCQKGYRESGSTCSKMEIGESGCLEAYQCDSGAICREGQCQCPTGYKAFYQKSKCVKNEAVINLPLGAPCDEINGRRFCAGGMQCYRCPSSNTDRCVNLVNVYPSSCAVRLRHIVPLLACLATSLLVNS